MSLNYYAKSSRHFAREWPESGLHIGQRAAGWEFLFRAHPQYGLVTCTAWYDLLHQSGVSIVDQHGASVDVRELWSAIFPTGAKANYQDRFTDVNRVSGEFRDFNGCAFYTRYFS